MIGGGDGMHVQVADDGTTYIGFQFGYYFRLNPDGSRDMVRPRDALGEKRRATTGRRRSCCQLITTKSSTSDPTSFTGRWIGGTLGPPSPTT